MGRSNFVLMDIGEAESILLEAKYRNNYKQMEATTTTTKTTIINKTKNCDKSPGIEEEDDCDDNISEEECFTNYYTIFNILSMIGYLLHNRKYWKYDSYINILLLLTYLWFGEEPQPKQASKKASHHHRHLQYRDHIFLLFLIFVLWTWISKLPYGANHKNMIGMVSLVLLPQQLKRCYKKKNNARTAYETKAALNIVRSLTILMYFFAGFHKINYDFLLEPNVSCAFYKVKYYIQLVGYGDINDEEDEEYVEGYDLPAWVLFSVPVMVIVIETIPALTLLIPNTKIQAFSVINFLLLHLILMPMGFVDFASIAQSFLILFVHPRNLVSSNTLPMHYYFYFGRIFVFHETLTVIHWYLDDDEDRPPFFESVCGLVLIGHGMIWLSVFNEWFPAHNTDKDNSTSQATSSPLPRAVKIWFPKSVWGILALVFFVFFAMNPYLGLRTGGTLNMFSNLRTEGPTSNHLLLKSNPLKFFQYQDDYITLLEVDERWNSPKFDIGETVHHTIFNREVKKCCDLYGNDNEDLYMRIEHDEAEIEIEDLCHDREWAKYRELRPFFERK